MRDYLNTFLSVTLILSICSLIRAIEISSPIFEDTIFSENIYKALSGQQVTCRLNLNSTDDINLIQFTSILILQNMQNNKIEDSVPILTSTSSIHINTLTLKTNNTYKCCIVRNKKDSGSKCSILKVSPIISSDYTSIAKIIGGLEMLVLALIMTLCLIMIILRFKWRQNKIIEATANKYIGDKDSEYGPYIITPNAQNFETGLSQQQPLTDEDFSKKDWTNTDFNLRVVTDSKDDGSDFPPTYEELVLRKIDSQIESIRF